MASIEKLKARLRNNPRSARYTDLERLLRSVGWLDRGGRGSHRRFEPPDGSSYLIIVKPHGREPLCAVADVEAVLAVLE